MSSLEYLGHDVLKTGSDKINKNFDKLQNQVNEIVKVGDSSVEAAQARVNGEGFPFGTLKERLDTEQAAVSAELAEKASQSVMDAKFGSMGSTKIFKGSCLNANLPVAGMIVDDYWYVSDLTTNKCWNGATWVDIGNALKIGDGSIAPIKATYFEKKIGKNKLKLSTGIPGKYYSTTTGTLITQAGNNAFLIPALPNTTYTNNKSSLRAFFNASMGFISGGSSGQTFTTPSGTAFIGTSILDANLATAQIEAADKATSWEAYYEYYVSTSEIFPVNDKIKTNIVTVCSDGTKDFTTVTRALLNINDASKTNKYEIHVYDGTTTETFTTKNYVDIIGQSIDGTIINFVGNPAVDINTQGAIYAASTSIIKNMTIKCIDGKYPIHSDAATGAYDLLIENCKLINLGSTTDPALNGAPIGIGLYGDQDITLRKCELIGFTPAVAATSGIAAVYCHNNSSTGHRSLTIEHCTSKECAYGVKLETLTGTTGQSNDCYLVNNNFGAIVSDVNYSDVDNTHAWKVNAHGNNIRRVTNDSTYIVEEEGFTKRIKALTRNINKGEVICVHNGSNYGYGIALDVAGSPRVWGIALENIITEKTGVIQVSGVVSQLKVNGVSAITNGDLLQTHAELGIAAKGTTNPFAIALQSYSTADSAGLISARLINRFN